MESDTAQKKIVQQILSYNIRYPEEAIINGIEGTVIVSFDIDSTCTLINRKIVQSIGYGCDEAVLKTLDKFQNDLKKQRKSKCEPNTITLPVQFRTH